MAVRHLASAEMLRPDATRRLSAVVVGFLSVLFVVDAAGQSVLPQLISKPGQSVLDQLKENEAAQKKAAPERSLGMTLKELCVLAEKEPNMAKCRGHYLSASYSVEWRGVDNGSNHPVAFEVLVRGDDAALCYGTAPFPLDEWSRCTPIQRSR